MFLIVALVLVFLLPSPWNLVAFAVGLVLFIGEVFFWNRTVRDKRASTGAETLIGRTATVVRSCRPDGQVRISFRSKDGTDVAALAEQFGGGGHRAAAGATTAGPLADAERRVIAAALAALGE